MKKYKIFLGLSIVAMCIFMVLAGVNLGGAPRVAYVDNAKLFESFVGKKEMEARLKKQEGSAQAVLDSMQLDIKAMEAKLMDKHDAGLKDRYQQKAMAFLQMQEEFMGKHESLGQQYTNEIWNQINQYVQDYGKLHKYDFIYGASGTGSMMYADEDFDITEKVLQYVNNRYAGGQ
jgi:outer membrane protein